MAGGKLTPRQKMINLMYLIFIAMLALNMSKEVLSAFGLMTEKLESANTDATNRNEMYLKGLEQKLTEQPEKYKPLMVKVQQVDALSKDFYAYIGSIKSDMLATVGDGKQQDYEIQDKADFLDERFFIGDKLKPEGQEFLDKISGYREGVTKILSGDKEFAKVIERVNNTFQTNPVTNRDGKKIDWLDYHYKGFPLVASITKLTQLQNDIKNTESEVLSSLLEGQLKVEASLTNFDAIVVADKTAFFAGESFKGKIILGKKDETLKAHKVIVNGKELPESAMQQGQTILEFPAGNVGDQTISGEFIFIEGGEEIKIPINSTYSVIPKPNSATISADKMNVVYRGVDNPMTISFAGVPDNLVNVTAPGLSKASKPGQYVMRPQQGTEVSISVTGKLPDGSSVNDKKTFRIKSIPPPTGHVRGESGVVKGPASSLENSTVSAKILDFDFAVDVQVTGFNLKVTGQPTVVVQGNRMSPAAVTAIKRAGRGDQVTISEIKTKLVGANIDLLKCSPVIYEIQ